MPETSYKVGDLVKCCVTGIEKYGFFVVTDEKYSGLVHISEMSEKFVKDVNDYVKIGENIVARIIGVDDEKKNLKLSIKNINYKTDGSSVLPLENGFEILNRKLPEWIAEALKKIDK